MPTTADQTPLAHWANERKGVLDRLQRVIDLDTRHLGQSNVLPEQKAVIRHHLRGTTKLRDQIAALTFRKERDEETAAGPEPGPVFPGQPGLYPGDG